ncbi:hypothetical protein RHGRI_014788 [Rhododendron griersonianum]|uniref:Uncharacterized protein n=1 Tax=Rhododendron griersonianum TaxID=479676 RepID=A0AAV6KAY0_9ERIC|nr:hypothetical protein RHGRI_014788 [Rhododendron griersonianum]
MFEILPSINKARPAATLDLLGAQSSVFPPNFWPSGERDLMPFSVDQSLSLDDEREKKTAYEDERSLSTSFPSTDQKSEVESGTGEQARIVIRERAVNGEGITIVGAEIVINGMREGEMGHTPMIQGATGGHAHGQGNDPGTMFATVWVSRRGLPRGTYRWTQYPAGKASKLLRIHASSYHAIILDFMDLHIGNSSAESPKYDTTRLMDMLCYVRSPHNK